MAQDKKRDFTGLWFILGAGILLVSIFTIVSHAFNHGPEDINSTWVKRHDQTVSAEVKDRLINSIFAASGFDVVCFDDTAGSFLVREPKHEHADGVYDSGWYLVGIYEFIQLQNKSYVIETFSNLTTVSPDVTGILCKNKNVN